MRTATLPTRPKSFFLCWRSTTSKRCVQGSRGFIHCRSVDSLSSRRHSLTLNPSQVEEAFEALQTDPNAMADYNLKQIDQLKAFIKMAIKVKTGADIMRVMVCITMDAHGRDVVHDQLVKLKVSPRPETEPRAFVPCCGRLDFRV